MQRLSAMLPDETLRMETRVFTNINRGFLIASMTLLISYFALVRVPELPRIVIHFLVVWQHAGVWITLFLVLLPTAMTMALIWKTKEVILSSVFRSDA